jgi:leucyl/phenylalanyl-tRNA--protein transferase
MDEPLTPPRPAPEAHLPPGEGVVAIGGRLEPGLVLAAYRSGVFPWSERGRPVTWWCPDPRAILPLHELHVPRRLARTLARGPWDVRVNEAFDEVVRACAVRPEGTWIHPEMAACYRALHARGAAHSLEVRREGRLVGGIFGVAVGGAFAAESMFHRARDASKVALVHLVRRLAARGFALLDVQFATDHLRRFGVRQIPRREYLARLAEVVEEPVSFA